MQSKCFIVQTELGLHTRPATLLAQVAVKFWSEIMIRNVTRNTPFVNAKSLIRVLTLGAAHGHEIEVTAKGEDEEAALAAIGDLINNHFVTPEANG